VLTPGNIFVAMRAAILGLLLLAAACGRRPEAEQEAREAAPAVEQLLGEDTRDSALIMPRLVTRPSVVVFWLAAGDTLHPDDAAAALDDLNYYTEQIGPDLERWGIALLPTNSDTLHIALPNDKRRSVLLTGLEFPFGYVIAEPGGVERILPGVYATEELLEEVRVYFDIEPDTTAAPPTKAITD
jgi:hypothetical protein